jgi:hypothetical protein
MATSLFLLLAIACSPGGSKYGDTAVQNETDGTGGSGSGTPVDSTGSGGTLAQSAWFALDGSLQLTDGEVDPELSALSVRFFEDSPPSLDLPLCASALAGLSTTSAPSPDPDVELATWWTLQAEGALDCPGQAFPSEVAVGIGPYDPLLDPAASRAGLETGTLNGLYAQVSPGSPLYIFGVIGTLEQFGGTLDASTAPLPDGSYELLTLHLLPMPTP